MAGSRLTLRCTDMDLSFLSLSNLPRLCIALVRLSSNGAGEAEAGSPSLKYFVLNVYDTLQSLALFLLLQSIMTLQPTTTSDPSRKHSAFKVHQIINLLLVLPLFTLGVAIMWYLHGQPGQSHFQSWHGKIGFSIVIWAWIQVAIGIAVKAFDGKLVGGQTRAKALYKWHRSVSRSVYSRIMADNCS
jgi:cytochrome b-561 domain-containing protein 2